MTMLNRRFIRRQLTNSWQQSAIFILSVALAMVSLVALRGLGDSINRALLSDAKELQAADIFVESNFPLSDPTSEEIDALVKERQAAREAGRAYVDAPDPRAAVVASRAAAEETFAGTGRDPTRLALTVDSLDHERCAVVEHQASYEFDPIPLPIVGSFGGAVTVTALYTIVASGGKFSMNPKLALGIGLMLVSILLITTNTPHETPGGKNAKPKTSEPGH